MSINPDPYAAIREALEEAGANLTPCERCQGNGEIVTDWDRYRHPREGDVGDEAVAECPDCSGEGTHTAAGAGPVDEAVAWLANAHSDVRMGRVIGLHEEIVRRDADSLFGPGNYDLIPLYAHPVEEPGEVEPQSKTYCSMLSTGVCDQITRAEAAEAALAETRGLIRDAIGLVPLAHQNWHTDARAAFKGEAAR